MTGRLSVNIHISRISEPNVSTAITIAQNLERRERSRASSKADARRSLASKLRVGIGTVENLVRGRVKRVDASIRDRLQALLVRELETEIARLTHELQVARQCGQHLAGEQVGEIETHLAKARALLTGGDT